MAPIEVNEKAPLLRVAAVTSGRNVPSARFRFRQHFDALREFGIVVGEHCPVISPYARYPGLLKDVKPRYLGPLGVGLVGARLLARVPAVLASHGYDATWLDRELLGSFYSFEGMLKQPLIVEMDDATWIDRPFVKRIAQRAECIIAGNNYIAEWASRYCGNVEVVPTAIDANKFIPSRSPGGEDSFVVGWTGTQGNLKYLYEIEAQLTEFFRTCPNARLKIVCDREPDFKDVPSSVIAYEPWTPENEAHILRTFDVGIMPLSDGEWEKGKCSFKMIQYMATGIPSVVSSVGMNNEILEKGAVGFGVKSGGDWVGVLKTLYADRELGRGMGSEGRKMVLDRYSVPVVSRRLAGIFRKYC